MAWQAKPEMPSRWGRGDDGKQTAPDQSQWHETKGSQAGYYGCSSDAEDTNKKIKTSGGAKTLHAPALETPASGPSTDVRPRVTSGGGGKEGDQDDLRG